ncbi:hypothetical protein DPSP01_013541 [Paraphaeosphaeria sporulosa]|uniref:Zn(2)-C6 fungal-type domain-containing protein n=1 Tax=Paraphaeosphaeria sporulosa TaxID=1460663 RepID=A0A177C2X4_9PLEO|nr:uncharacterized protein CC84DRAFT_280817 [Paraphaeosphaeria sporulosa]OAG01259.1 hypothetical protein CC84DRAFT_280817 [Paraphaeosphaeria sporulosa]
MTASEGGKAKRTRSSTPRSRTGCLTCRKRRIKCDETKPACLKCTQAGWTCDGFVAQPDPGSSAVTLTSSPPTLAITRYSIPFQVPGSQKDRQLLHYFCVQGSRELAGFLNLDFWTRTVFEQSHQEAAVRQALVSLSSLHLDYTTGALTRSGIARNDTLMQYGKALRMLQRRMKTSDAEATRTALICSVLFYCFEATLGHNEAATHHLQGGLNMLSYWRSQGAEQTDDLAGISLEFERLDLQTTLFYDQPIPHRPFPWHVDGEEGSNVRSFQRLSDAHRALVKAIGRGWRLLCDNLNYKFSPSEDIPESILREKLHLQETLLQWKVSFDLFKEQHSERTQTAYGHQILVVHWHIARMLLDAILPADMDVWGASPNPRAAEMLRLIEDVLDREQSIASSPASSISEPTQRVVTSEMGVIAPLFAMALKCADQDVSRRAFELLRSVQRREGLWEASHMSSLVSKLRRARVLRFGPRGEAALTAARSQSLEMLFYDELGSAEGLLSMDTKSPQLQKSVEALWASFEGADGGLGARDSESELIT